MPNNKGRPTKREVSAVVLALLMASLVPALILAAPAAHATSEDLSSWCTIAGTSYAGGTCTVTGRVTMSVPVVISPGETLATASHGSLILRSDLSYSLTVVLTIESGGTLSIENSFSCVSSNGCNFVAITNNAVIDNSGTINVENSYSCISPANYAPGPGGGASFICVGIYNYGVIHNYGTVNISDSETCGIGGASFCGGIDNLGTFTNYGVLENNGVFGNSGGTLNEECGDVLSGSTITGGTINTFACGPVYLGMQSALSLIQDTLSTLSNSLSSLSNSVTTGFSTVESDLSTITGSLTSIQSEVNGLLSQIAILQSDVASIGHPPLATSGSGETPLTPSSDSATLFTSSNGQVGTVTISLNTTGVGHQGSVIVRYFTDPANPGIYIQKTVTAKGDTGGFTDTAAAWKVQVVASFGSGSGSIMVDWAYSSIQPPS